MCFKMIDEVELVANPDVVRSISVQTKGQHETRDDLMFSLRTAVQALLDNRLVEKVLEEATSVGIVKGINSPEDGKVKWENAVLVTSPPIARFVHSAIAHPEVLWVSHHKNLANRMVVLKLEDFGYLVQYSLNVISEKPGIIEAEVRLKFGTKASRAVIYRLPANWTDALTKPVNS